MKCLIAPDSFKGTLAAADVAAAIGRGLIRAVPDVEASMLPLADGGEGSTVTLVNALGGRMVGAAATDPRGRPLGAHYGLVEQTRVAVIDVAEASGLQRLDPNDLDPLAAGSYGTGELIRDALDRDVDAIWLCLGGSATVDGALGLACALGAVGYDAGGNTVPANGQGLLELERLDLAGLDPRVRGVEVVALCDVQSELLGPRGARLYMPQKGASSEQIELLDTGLARWEQVLFEATGQRTAELPGAGAAGGIGAGVAAILGAALVSGVDFVLDAVGFEHAVDGADWVISGEGRVDEQTAQGKVVAGVARRVAGRAPLVVVCGDKGPSLETLYASGVTAVFPIAQRPVDDALAFANTADWLEETAFSLGRLLKAWSGTPARR